MNSSKPVTDKGMVLIQKCYHDRHLIIGFHFSLEYMQGTYTPGHEEPAGQTPSRGTYQDDQIPVSGNRKDRLCLSTYSPPTRIFHFYSRHLRISRCKREYRRWFRRSLPGMPGWYTRSNPRNPRFGPPETPGRNNETPPRRIDHQRSSFGNLVVQMQIL